MSRRSPSTRKVGFVNRRPWVRFPPPAHSLSRQYHASAYTDARISALVEALAQAVDAGRLDMSDAVATLAGAP